MASRFFGSIREKGRREFKVERILIAEQGCIMEAAAPRVSDLVQPWWARRVLPEGLTILDTQNGPNQEVRASFVDPLKQLSLAPSSGSDAFCGLRGKIGRDEGFCG